MTQNNQDPSQQDRIDARPVSVAAMFIAQVSESGPREAFRYLDGERWVSLTWDETKEKAFALAAGLRSLGIGLEDRVAIASSTRIEWVLADLAVSCSGGATTTVYPTTQHDDFVYVLNDSATQVVIVEDETQVRKVLDHLDAVSSLTKIVQIDGVFDHELVIGWAELETLGQSYLAEKPAAIDEAIAEIGPEHLATLMYTSGTTGRPKGVRLTQDCWTYEGVGAEEADIVNRDDLQYLWLPLSHVFGKALLAIQLRIGFATAVDGRIEKIVDNLGQVNPTFMAGAPRIYEKVRAKVIQGASHGVKSKIFTWAFAVGKKSVPIRLAGKQPSGLLGVQYALADRLVFSKIKDRMGGRIRFFISGSAALNREVQEWFYAAGLLILEGYGLTETSAASCFNDPRTPRFGTVGPPLPGTQIKTAADGEILIKGPGVMRGYHGNDEATAEVLKDGWFTTGDIGELDEEGYLKITDRKKDLIKTSGGKYVAPQKVEGVLKASCPYLSQVVIHGEGRKYVTALVTLDPEAIEQWAADHDHDSTGYEDLVTSAEVHELIEDYVAQANQKLERWETIKRFEVLASELSVDEGEVTPSLKVKRRLVEKRYADTLDALYDKD